ncbi:ATP-binding protein [Streptomyces sp. SID13666]|uniref:ATP-binding protein n=1 Tax=unclassified Streptomyces TaxID=2593676 RepID=UPI0013BF683F|nr:MULTISPECIES: ATP-binding protein [unclassified Streptomyces]NEA58849.1 ATP-binding protein [Streptomyces sp. SID13666]NEA74521.1 ATP-binding protein [Streptomyces sp. SID13588]
MATKTARSNGQGIDDAQFPVGIALVGSEMRSTNLERDVREPHLNNPYIGVRALDLLERVTNAAADLRRTRAWTFTGPYGSGKSTLSNLFDAFLGHDKARRAEAEAAVAATSPGQAARLARVRDELAPEGFLGAVATADREPLATTIIRALQTAAERKWKKRIPKAVAQAFAACTDPTIPSTQSLIEAVTVLCSVQPVLLIIDEFGKNLEYIAADGAGSDVFLLQMLAEKSAGPSGLPLFMFTLQHLAFTDYAARSSSIQTQEWAKVQGRFEDVTFAPNLGDAVHLMRRRLDHAGVAEAGQRLIEVQAKAAMHAWTDHALNALVDISTEMFADLYPLHPLTAIAAPELASQIGQNDRSLTGFLASDEPNTVRRTLDTSSKQAPEHASTIRLPQLYDYFFSSGRTTIIASANASRWLEVDHRLNEARGLSAEDQAVLKSIGILNLIDADGVLRATPAMIQFALNDPADAPDPERYAALQEQLDRLVADGFVVHRAYSNEYRVWRGTDFDIDAGIRVAAKLITPAVVVEYFSEHLGSVLPAAVVAGGHSQRTGMLRYFSSAVSYKSTALKGPTVVQDAADGLIVFHLGPLSDRPMIDSPLPALIGTTKNPEAVLQAGIDLVALEELLDDEALDYVARREVEERAAYISKNIGTLLDEAFNPLSPQSTWHLWSKGTETTGDPGEPIDARSYANLASQACDRVFPHSPRIRNEMVGRHQLTSIGSRARREVLTGMLQRSGTHLLGYDQTKYTPERAMYHGVVEYLGLHRAADEARADATSASIHTHGISRPDPKTHPDVIKTWEALEEALSNATQPTPIVDIYERLMAPPYGIKAGVVPILVVTALILHAQDVALFEEGNYCQRLTPEIIERLNVPYPERFTVKAAPAGRGQRRLIVEGLTRSLHVDSPRSGTARNPALLGVTRAIVERVMVLEPYAQRTRSLSAEALAIREVLSRATDPDDLVFAALPTALGFEAILPNSSKNETLAKDYVTRLTAALDELSSAGAALRQHIVATIGNAFRLPPELPTLRAGLRERLRGFADSSLELNLQGFVSRVLNENLPDEDWLDPIIIRLANKALGDWTDRDVDSFPRQVQELARALDRVSHLYEVRSLPQIDRQKTEPQQLDTHLLTLTTPQGNEERTLIHVPKQSRQAADDLVVSVIRQAEEALGPDGARILLAALAERIAARDATTDQTKESL